MEATVEGAAIILVKMLMLMLMLNLATKQEICAKLGSCYLYKENFRCTYLVIYTHNKSENISL